MADHGRTRELDAILAAFDSAVDGGARVVLVTGEPGIGKSWLLATASHRLADERSALVLEGYALDLPGAPPAFPLIRALGDTLARLREEPNPLIRSARAALAAAGIGPPLLDAASPSRNTTPDDRLRVFEALAVVCAWCARAQPLVLRLDDMQWASAFTWDAIRYAVRALRDAPVLFLLAARDDVLRTGFGPGSEPIAELIRLRLLSRVPLAELDGAAIAAIATERLGKPAAPRLVDFLMTRSEGSPFFAEEVLSDCRERDALIEGPDAWDLRADAKPDALSLPLSLRLAIDVRIERLPAATDEAMAAGATLGREFAAPTVAMMLETDVDGAARALAPAEAAGMIDRVPTGWRFHHDTVREAVVARHTHEAQRLHRAAATALARELGYTPGYEALAALAHHWLAAGDSVRGATAALAAAGAASRARATGEALELSRTAREAYEVTVLREPDEHRRALLAARLAHGTAALAHAEYDEAEEALRAAIGMAGDDRLYAGLGWLRLGTVERRRERVAEAAGAFARAIECLDTGEHEAELGEALVALCDLDGLTRARYEEARAAGERALEIARSAGDRDLAARAALALANAEIRDTDPLGGRALLLEAHAAALGSGDAPLAAEVCASLTNTYYWTGELRESLRYAEQRRALAERAGDLFAVRHASSWLALLEITRGEWDRARELIERAEHELARLPSPEPLAFLQVVDGFLSFRLGDLDRACEQLGRAVATFERIDPGTVVWYGSLLALALTRAGRTAEARVQVAAQQARLSTLPESSLPARSARCALGLTFATLGERELGAVCEAALRPYAEDYHWAPMRLTLAALAALRGDNATSLADLAVAESQAREEGRLPDLALIRLQRAVALPRREAAVAAEAARAELEALGMRADAVVAEALLSSLRRGPGPGGLSPREIEVLRLVAQGQTNREIAEALVISERTAVNHVSHIFDKLGVNHRAEAAAWATREGII